MARRRVVFLVRKSDEWLVDELDRIVQVKQEMGVRTSLGFEICRLLRKALVKDFDQFLEMAKELGLYEVWKEKFEKGDSTDEH